ncbi:EAL and modified HD-GYP domain-containing signal transduction protein [Rhodoferax ferrireducens]|uniref:EAL and modified HD-GYP domain-containing signal transduction protein n=1 Tax=Rhodoferax ferrireducens TaxID=192843 RepID=A0ABU2C5E8_9BURK|nr:HDOD domain-containing protein [Rhodoferax ferrireducens]MDR7376548.1 EAL and modified HD-GYP domain-containing signal transduction protein [Rhodoferax ferrireducens]
MSTIPDELQGSKQPSDAEEDSHVLIARQAIVDENRAVFGYELYDRSTPSQGYTADSDAALLFNALSFADTETLVGQKLVFINCTLASLAGGHLELIHPDKVVLEVPPVPGNLPEDIESHAVVLEDLRKRGFKFAFNHSVLTRGYAPWRALASFVKLDMTVLKPEMVQPFVKFATANTTAQLIAEKVETAEQHQLLTSYGIKLFQGYWFAKPALVKAQTIRPSQATILQLINLVRKQATTAEIEELLKRDPTLSFNLLRFINSSGFGLNCEITSFRHAVMILGLKKLFRWAALLMTTSRNGGAPPAVGQTAVVRGRLMELLTAEMLSPEDCDNAFVVGVFSLLDAMLGVPLAKALESVALPQPVLDALLYRTGVFAPFLALTEACESGDDEVFGRTAEALHLSNKQVNWAHLQALAWAESLAAD